MPAWAAREPLCLSPPSEHLPPVVTDPPAARLNHTPSRCPRSPLFLLTLSPLTLCLLILFFLLFSRILSFLSCTSCLPRAPFPWPCALLTPTVTLSHLGTYAGGLILHSLQSRHLHNDMRFSSGNTNNSLPLRDWAPKLGSYCARPPGVQGDQ